MVITDPHIKNSADSFVYSRGMNIEQHHSTTEDKANIFIKDPQGGENYVGKCWPGESVWVDYLNENAQEFWKGLYTYNSFNGTNYIYGMWNDMNEPSVFKGSVEIE